MARSAKIIIIANDRAVADLRLREAVKRLRRQGADIEVNPMWDCGDGRRLAVEAAQKHARVVIAAGGDGSVNEVVNGLMSRGGPRPSVAVLPYGTANDFAKAFHVPINNPSSALRLAFKAARPIDLGRVNGCYFVNAATGGTPAEVTRTAPKGAKHKLGRIAYYLSSLRHFHRLKGQPAVIRAPRFRWKGKLVAIALGNGRQSGGGVRFAPRANLNDGHFDVVFLPEQPIAPLLAGIKDVLSKRPIVHPRNMISFRAPWLTLTSVDGLQFNLDGEPIQHRSYHFEIVKNALRFHLPG
jgi:lipid kinase YegS